MKPGEIPSELRALVDQFLDETISAEGLQQLERALQGNAEAQRFFLRYCQLHIGLDTEARLQRALDAFASRQAVAGRPASPVPRTASRLRKIAGALRAIPTSRRLLVAAAAAIVVAVGLWPFGRSGGRGGPGRVYGMPEAIDLLRKSRILHVSGFTCVPFSPRPGQEPRRVAVGGWVDTVEGRTRRINPAIFDGNDETTVPLGEEITDGEFQMALDHTHKTASFERVTRLQCLLDSRISSEAIIKQMFGDTQKQGQFKSVGQEAINGRMFTMWEGEGPDLRSGPSPRLRWWLDPVTGDIGRVCVWSRNAGTGQDQNPTPVTQFDTIERLDAAPEGTFATVPPAGYRMLNEKASAPQLDPLYEGGFRMGSLSYNGYVAFMLEDESIIFGWISEDRRAAVPLAKLFENLTCGGPVPKLPVEIYGLEQVADGQQITYTGRHLAFTCKGDRFVEWSLYAPEHSAPAAKPGRRSHYKALYRFNSAQQVSAQNLSRAAAQMLIHRAIRVDASSFDALVRQAISEFGGGVAVPEEITYTRVMELGRQIRESAKGHS